MSAKHTALLSLDAIRALAPPPPADAWSAGLLDRASQRLAVLHAVLVEHLTTGTEVIPDHARRRLAAEALQLDRVLRQIDALVQEARPEPSV